MTVYKGRQRWARAASMGALAAGAVWGLVACGEAGKGQQAHGEAPPAPVTVVAVQQATVRPWDAFNGRIEAKESVEIRPRVSGYIEAVRFQEGQPVRKGQVLVSIDARPYQATLASAQAQLQRAKAAAALAQAQDRRARDLVRDRAIAAEEADNRAGTLAQALAQVQEAEAAVTTARLDLQFTEVRAPISGLAGRALLTVGNLAQANQSMLTTVVSQDPVFVYFDADEQSLLRNRQQPGGRDQAQPVRVALASEEGFPHEARLSFTDNRIDRQTGTISVRATLPNPNGLFVPGMFARVQLQGSRALEAVVIDDKAVLTDQDRKYVYVVGAGERAERRELQLGRMVDGQRIVLSGLQAGDRLVVAGMQRIYYPGMPLAPKPPAAQGQATDAKPAAIAAVGAGEPPAAATAH